MKKQLYIIDGYNMIGAWPELRVLKNRHQLEAARDHLLHICSNFSKFEGVECWLVFDAQFVPGIQQSYEKYQVRVIFTQEGETADEYIERTVANQNHLLYQVSVATSDLAEQWVVFQKGALRKSAMDFYREIKRSLQKQRDLTTSYNHLGAQRRSPWSEEQWGKLDDLRYKLHYRSKE